MKNTILFVLIFPCLMAAQTEINNPAVPTYYAAYDSVNSVYHIGITLPGQVTTSGQPDFTSSSDALVFLQSTSDIPVVYKSLPITGELVEKDGIYQYEDKLVICRQTHTRTLFDPADTPALFAVWRASSPEQALVWIIGEVVYPRMIREHLGGKYECIQQHQTVIDQSPDLVPALWIIYTPPGDCPGWVQPTGAQDAYDVGDCVTFEGQEWINTSPANVFEPGVFGWELQ